MGPGDRDQVGQDLEAATRGALSYRKHLRMMSLRPKDLTILELCSARHFGPLLVLAGMGARVSVADPSPAPWDPDFHPRLYSALAKRCARSAGALERCVAQGSYDGVLEVVTSPVDRLETVVDGAFDLVISNAYLEHPDDLGAVAQEMARVTRTGGLNSHQVDFRDARDPARPLEFLLANDEVYAEERRLKAGVQGSRIRPEEVVAHFGAAGFELVLNRVNAQVPEPYLEAFMPRLRASRSSYRHWPEESLRQGGGRFVLRAVHSAERRQRGRDQLGAIASLRRRVAVLERSDLLEHLRSIMRMALFDPQIVVEEASVIDELPEWNEIHHLEIIAAIEQRFSVRFEAEEIMEVATVGDLLDRLERRLTSAAAGEARPAVSAHG